MDNDIFKGLEEKITSIESDDVYKREIGNLTIWFAPLSYTDQNFVSEALESGNITSINLAKLKALSRSIVGIDEYDLRKYRNSTPVFEIFNQEKKRVKVDLAKYIESKVIGWGINFVDTAFDVFSDISETSKKKFSDGIVLENTKDPRVELAELEAKVHELRSQLGMPLLIEKPDSKYATSEGDPYVEESSEPTPDLTDVVFQEDPQTVDPEPPLVEEFSSEEEILKSVEPPVVSVEPPPTVTIPDPVRTIPISSPPDVKMSPIAVALEARKRMGQPMRDSNSVPTAPAIDYEEVVESRSTPITGRPKIDPSVSSQSINPRFKRNA